MVIEYNFGQVIISDFTDIWRSRLEDITFILFFHV